MDGTAPERHGTFARAVALSTAGSGIVLLLSLANNIALARLAGPEGRGVYALAMSIMLVASPVLTAGTSVAAVHYLGRGMRPDAVRGLGLVLLAGWTLVLGAAGAALWALEVSTSGIPAAGWALLLLTVPTIAYVQFSRSTWLGLGRVRAFVGAQVGPLALVVAANLLLVTPNPLRVLAILAGVWWVAVLVQALLHARDGLALPRGNEATRLVRFGLRAVVTRLAGLGFSRADYLILPWLVSMADVGIYAIADQSITALATFALAAGSILQSDAARTGASLESVQRLARTSRLVVALAVAIAIVGSATFWWILPAVFGARFAASYPAFLLLVPVLLLRSVSALLGPYLEGLGVQRPVVLASIAALLSILLLVTPLVAWLGVVGAAVAKTIAALVQLAVLWRAVPKGARSAGMLRIRTADVRRAWMVVARRHGMTSGPLAP